MSPQNISKLLRNSSPFDETPSRSLMPKTTASKKKHRRNRSQKKNKRNQSQKAEKRKSRNNSLLLMNWRTLLRNEVELSPKRFLAEGSTKGVSAQDLRSKFQPIYHQAELVSKDDKTLNAYLGQVHAANPLYDCRARVGVSLSVRQGSPA